MRFPNTYNSEATELSFLDWLIISSATFQNFGLLYVADAATSGIRFVIASAFLIGSWAYMVRAVLKARNWI